MAVARLLVAVVSAAMKSDEVTSGSIGNASKSPIELPKPRPSVETGLGYLTSGPSSVVALLAIGVMVLNFLAATLISARVGAINCFENASGIRGEVVVAGACGGFCS